MGYKGPWPTEETKEAPAPAGVSAEEFWKLVGRLEALERTVQNLAEGYQAHILKEPEKAHPHWLK